MGVVVAVVLAIRAVLARRRRVRAPPGDGGLRPLLVAAIVVAALAHLPRVPTAREVRAGVRWPLEGPQGGLVLAGLAVLVLVPIAAFPSNPVAANAVTNLYSHFLGYSLGFIVPYAAVSVAGYLGRHGESLAGPRPAARTDASPRVRGSHGLRGQVGYTGWSRALPGTRHRRPAR